jgi:Gpi18-like mannosyltransferase
MSEAANKRLAGANGSSVASVTVAALPFARHDVKGYVLSWLLMAFGLAVTVGIRFQLLNYRSGDMNDCLLPWCDSIEKTGLVQALKSGSIDYNVPYIYFLWLVTHLPFDRVWAIKSLSILCDYGCALAAGLIVWRIHRSALRATSTAFALLIAPTVVFNSAFWGQSDMVYAAPLVAGVAAELGKRHAMAAVFFGLAIAVKLQAIFLFPLLGVWVLRREFPWRPLLLIPLVFFLFLVPAWMAGSSLVDLLAIYPRQTQKSSELTINAASIFAFLPNNAEWFGDFGLWFAMAAIFLVVLACLGTRVRTTPALALRQAATFACLAPFLLPHMHDRYAFLGDVLCVLYAFLRPKYFWVALLVLGASFTSYFKFLFGGLPVPLPIASLMLGTACVFLVFDLLRSLYPAAFGGEVPPGSNTQTVGT